MTFWRIGFARSRERSGGWRRRFCSIIDRPPSPGNALRHGRGNEYVGESSNSEVGYRVADPARKTSRHRGQGACPTRKAAVRKVGALVMIPPAAVFFCLGNQIGRGFIGVSSRRRIEPRTVQAFFREMDVGTEIGGPRQGRTEIGGRARSPRRWISR